MSSLTLGSYNELAESANNFHNAQRKAVFSRAHRNQNCAQAIMFCQLSMYPAEGRITSDNNIYIARMNSSSLMHSAFVLSNWTRYRRESFGGIVFNTRTQQSTFYDLPAAFAIERFANPTSLDSVCAHFKEQALAKEFLTALIARGVLSEPSTDTLRAQLFFTDVTEFRNDRLHSPLGVELELTLRCGRNCTYCAYSSNPQYSTIGQLSKAQYKDILLDLANCGVCYVRFTGGDPLIRPDALTIIETADELPFALTVASDLTVLNTEKAARLAALKHLAAVQTTLDGPTSAIADKHRGSGNFLSVCRGMEMLSALGVKLLVGTVLTKENTKHIYQTAELLSKWNVAYCVSPLYSAGRGREMEHLIPTNDDLAYAYEEYAAAINDGLVRPGDPAWHPLAASKTRDSRALLWAGQPWLVRSPDRILRIDPLGRCYAGIQLKEYLGDEVYIGSITDSSTVSLWNTAPLLNRLRKATNHNRYYGEVIDLRTALTSIQNNN